MENNATKKLEEMSKDELSQYQNEKENDLRRSMEAREIFASQKIRLENEIYKLRMEINTMKAQYSEADKNVKVLNSLLREIRNRYFNVQI